MMMPRLLTQYERFQADKRNARRRAQRTQKKAAKRYAEAVQNLHDMLKATGAKGWQRRFEAAVGAMYDRHIQMNPSPA